MPPGASPSSTCCAVVHPLFPVLISTRGAVMLKLPPAAPLTPNASIARCAPASRPPPTASAFNAMEPPVPFVSVPELFIHAPPLACRATSLPSDSSAPGDDVPKLMVPPSCQVCASNGTLGAARSLVHIPRTSSVTPSPTYTPGRPVTALVPEPPTLMTLLNLKVPPGSVMPDNKSTRDALTLNTRPGGSASGVLAGSCTS